MSELQVLEQQSVQLVEEAKRREISNQTTYDEGALFLTSVRMLKTKIQGFFKPTVDKFIETKKKADEGRKAELDRMNVYLQPVVEAEAILKQKVKEYENVCAQKAEAERLAREEKEKARLQKEADEAREWGEEKTAQVAEEEAKLHKEKVQPKVHKVPGLGISRRWNVRITDKSKVPLCYMNPDMVTLRQMAVQGKENFCVPGCEAYQE